MSREQEEEEKKKPSFKVEDRRRFSLDGEARPTAPEEKEPTPSGTSPQGAVPAPSLAGLDEAQRAPIGELSFSTFVISLCTQALAHLGEIPDPISRQHAVDLGAAQQLIDILAILQVKTKGNLDPSESALLDSALYDLRIQYVERVRGAAKS